MVRRCRGLDLVRIRYRVYAFEFTVDTSYLDDIHAIINGASVFMFVEGLENEPIFLEVNPFPAWERISTSLDEVDGNEKSRRFVAPNYDILIDSPIEVGNQKIFQFKVSGIDHSISISSEGDHDWAPLVQDIRTIVQTTVPIFGEIPYDRYVFLIDISAGELNGGLEHLASTQCIAPYYRLFPKQEYRQLLTLFSHEFFHAWNVKRMRPAGLGPFNYSSETYTRSLWIAEGITSYYDDLIVRRAGLFSPAEYLDSFVQNVNLMSSLPGSKWESAEESSFDTWIRHYRANENTPNVHSSYYVQGAVIAWMIDMEIRKSTMNQKSLDDVLRKIYRDTFKMANRGYTDEEFENACNEISASPISMSIFEGRVRGRRAVDFQKYLNYSGLTLRPKSEKDSAKGFLGMKVRSDGGRTVISTVLFETPAESAGIAAGDEVIAIETSGLMLQDSLSLWETSHRVKK
ncbi:MAG: M61 family metallopeptidase [Nitrososphaerales archaeon]